MSKEPTPSPISKLDVMPDASKWLRAVPGHPEIAYAIVDPAFNDFHVRASANAWWMDSGKVHKLIDAYKMNMTDFRACVYAGISKDQLAYFKLQHPDFSSVKERARETATIIAHQTVFNDMQDPRTAKWWLGEVFRREHASAAPQTPAETMIEAKESTFYDEEGNPTYSEKTLTATTNDAKTTDKNS